MCSNENNNKLAAASESTIRNQVLENSGSREGGGNGGKHLNTSLLPSISNSKREEEVQGPFIDRQFSVRPSIFAPSKMDMEMRQPTTDDRSEPAIRQRLAYLVKYFSEMDSSSDDGDDTESETADNRESTIEASEPGIQLNGPHSEVELPSAINIGPETAGEQSGGHSSRNGVTTLPSGAGETTATQGRQKRRRQHSHASLPSDARNHAQSEIQVYDDRVPVTAQVSGSNPCDLHSHPKHFCSCIFFFAAVTDCILSTFRLRRGRLIRTLIQAMRHIQPHD